jgi:type II secretory pathway pseudopilin PulG
MTTNRRLQIYQVRQMQRNTPKGIQGRVFDSQSVIREPHSDDRGYTLVALIAVMTLLALFAMAAAPNISQQAQREREKEAIFRGEEVANAIRMYVEYRNSQNARGVAALPTSMDQLLEGIPKGTHKVQILRPEAAVDPLSSKGEWRLISPTSPDLVQFVQAVTVYAGGTPPPTRGSFQQFVPQLMNVINTGSTDTAPGGEDSSDNTTGPFLGVASRSQRDSVITYYGIDRHDQWIFTPLFR